MMVTHGHCMIHPVIPLTIGGGMLEDYKKVIEALGGLLRLSCRIWGRNESADTPELFSAREDGQVKRKRRSSRQKDCKVEGLMAEQHGGKWKIRDVGVVWKC